MRIYILWIVITYSSALTQGQCTSGNRTTFLRSYGVSVAGADDRVLNNVALNQCGRLCASNQDGQDGTLNCQSYEYSLSSGRCVLSGASAPPFGNSPLTPTINAMAFYQKVCISSQDVCAAPFSFERVPQHVLVGFALQMSKNLTLSECLKDCLESGTRHNMECRSIMYYYETEECILNQDDRRRRPDLFTADTKGFIVDYFENHCAGSQCLAPEISQYLLTEGAELANERDVTISNIDLDMCQHFCNVDQDGSGKLFSCRSFAYDSGTEECHLSNEKAEPIGSGKFQDTAGIDYYEKICFSAPQTCTNQPAFVRVPQRVLVGHSLEVSRTATVTDCLNQCLAATTGAPFVCRSVMYYYETGECIINDATRSNNPDMFSPDTKGRRVDYFDNLCTQNVDPCSSEGKHTVYIKVHNAEFSDFDTIALPDLTIAECLEACTQERTFKCRSVEYSMESICSLSHLENGQIPLVYGASKQQKDYYESLCLKTNSRCAGRIYAFQLRPDKEFTGFIGVTVSGVSVERCLSLCLADSGNQRCLSVNYDRPTSTCQLNTESCRTRGVAGLLDAPGSDYFENECVEPQTRCKYNKASSGQRLQSLYRLATLPGVTLDACKAQCDRSREFLCRSLSHSEVTQTCDLGDTDTSKLDIDVLLIPRAGHEYYERRACSGVTLETACHYSGATVTVNFENARSGSVYTRNHFDTCRQDFQNTNEATLEVPIPGSTDNQCGGQQTSNTQFSYVVVVQTNDVGFPGLTTDQDQLFNVSCFYEKPLDSYNPGSNSLNNGDNRPQPSFSHNQIPNDPNSGFNPTDNENNVNQQIPDSSGNGRPRTLQPQGIVKGQTTQLTNDRTVSTGDISSNRQTTRIVTDRRLDTTRSSGRTLLDRKTEHSRTTYDYFPSQPRAAFSPATSSAPNKNTFGSRPRQRFSDNTEEQQNPVTHGLNGAVQSGVDKTSPLNQDVKIGIADRPSIPPGIAGRPNHDSDRQRTADPTSSFDSEPRNTPASSLQANRTTNIRTYQQKTTENDDQEFSSRKFTPFIHKLQHSSSASPRNFVTSKPKPSILTSNNFNSHFKSQNVSPANQLSSSFLNSRNSSNGRGGFAGFEAPGVGSFDVRPYGLTDPSGRPTTDKTVSRNLPDLQFNNRRPHQKNSDILEGTQNSKGKNLFSGPSSSRGGFNGDGGLGSRGGLAGPTGSIYPNSGSFPGNKGYPGGKEYGAGLGNKAAPTIPRPSVFDRGNGEGGNVNSGAGLRGTASRPGTSGRTPASVPSNSNRGGGLQFGSNISPRPIEPPKVVNEIEETSIGGDGRNIGDKIGSTFSSNWPGDHGNTLGSNTKPKFGNFTPGNNNFGNSRPGANSGAANFSNNIGETGDNGANINPINQLSGDFKSDSVEDSNDIDIENSVNEIHQFGDDSEEAENVFPEGFLRADASVNLELIRDGRPVTAVLLGEKISIRWRLRQPVPNVGFFVRDCVAERLGGLPPPPAPLQLISEGCPEISGDQAIVTGPVTRGEDDSLVAPLTIFRFDGSKSVKITCEVDMCLQVCNPTTCRIDQVPIKSYGKRKKRAVLRSVSLPEYFPFDRKNSPHFSAKKMEKGAVMQRGMVSGVFIIVDHLPQSQPQQDDVGLSGDIVGMAIQKDLDVKLIGSGRNSNPASSRNTVLIRDGKVCIANPLFIGVFTFLALLCLAEAGVVVAYFWNKFGPQSRRNTPTQPSTMARTSHLDSHLGTLHSGHTLLSIGRVGTSTGQQRLPTTPSSSALYPSSYQADLLNLTNSSDENPNEYHPPPRARSVLSTTGSTKYGARSHLGTHRTGTMQSSKSEMVSSQRTTTNTLHSTRSEHFSASSRHNTLGSMSGSTTGKINSRVSANTSNTNIGCKSGDNRFTGNSSDSRNNSLRYSANIINGGGNCSTTSRDYRQKELSIPSKVASAGKPRPVRVSSDVQSRPHGSKNSLAQLAHKAHSDNTSPNSSSGSGASSASRKSSSGRSAASTLDATSLLPPKRGNNNTSSSEESSVYSDNEHANGRLIGPHRSSGSTAFGDAACSSSSSSVLDYNNSANKKVHFRPLDRIQECPSDASSDSTLIRRAAKGAVGLGDASNGESMKGDGNNSSSGGESGGRTASSTLDGHFLKDVRQKGIWEMAQEIQRRVQKFRRQK